MASFSVVRNNNNQTLQSEKYTYNNIQKRIASTGDAIKLAEFAKNGLIELPTFTNFDINPQVLCNNSFIYVKFPAMAGTITATLPSSADLIACMNKAYGFKLPPGFTKYIVFSPGGNPPGLTTSIIKFVTPDPATMIIGSSTTTSNNLLSARKAVSALIYIVNSSPDNPQYKVLFTRNT